MPASPPRAPQSANSTSKSRSGPYAVAASPSRNPHGTVELGEHVETLAPRYPAPDSTPIPTGKIITATEAMELESGYISAFAATEEWSNYQTQLAAAQEIDTAGYVAFEIYARPKVQKALRRACQRALDLSTQIIVKTLPHPDKKRRRRMQRQAKKS